MAEAFVRESRTVRLSPITTDGAAEALALLGMGKADLAVGRGDLEMPADAQTVAVVRKNFVALWSPSGLVGKSSKRKPAPKIKEIADLAGHKVGVIGQDTSEPRTVTAHFKRRRRADREDRGSAIWHGKLRT